MMPSHKALLSLLLGLLLRISSARLSSDLDANKMPPGIPDHVKERLKERHPGSFPDEDMDHERHRHGRHEGYRHPSEMEPKERQEYEREWEEKRLIEEAKKQRHLDMLDEWCAGPNEVHLHADGTESGVCQLRALQRSKGKVPEDFVASSKISVEELEAAEAYWCAKPEHEDSYVCHHGFEEGSRELDIMRMREWWCSPDRSQGTALCQNFAKAEADAVGKHRDMLAESATRMVRNSEVYLMRLMNALGHKDQRAQRKVGNHYWRMRKTEDPEFADMHEGWCSDEALGKGGFICNLWAERKPSIRAGDL